AVGRGDGHGRLSDDRTRDALHLALIQPAQTAYGERDAAFRLGDSLEHGVGLGLARKPLDGHSAHVHVCAPGLVLRVGPHHGHAIRYGLVDAGDADAVDLAQLFGGVLAGVERELALELDVLEWAGERIKPHALTDAVVVGHALLAGERRQIPLGD